MSRFLCWLVIVTSGWFIVASRCPAAGAEIEVEHPEGTFLFSGAGTVVAWGSNDYGQTSVPQGLTGVRAVAAGDYHSLALLEDGSVTGWGRNDSGQTTLPAALSGAAVKAIAAGSGHSVALLADGTVVAWGLNSSGECNVPANLTGVVAIAARGTHTAALRSNGTFVQWGATGSMPPPAGVEPLRTLTTGLSHYAGIRQDGRLVVWGANAAGQATWPSFGAEVVDVAAGDAHNLGLKTNTTVAGWGLNTNDITKPPDGLTGVFSMACGSLHSVALKQDGSVVAWGQTLDNQTAVPAGLTDVRALAAGSRHTVALVKPRSRVNCGAAFMRADAPVTTFHVWSTGQEILHLKGITVQGGQASDFTVSTALMPTDLSPGTGGAFSVQFRPSFESLRSTVLRVECDDADEHWFEVQLEGTGLSSEANLGDFGIANTFSSLTPSFSRDITNYTYHVLYATAALSIFARPVFTNSTMQLRLNGGAWSPLSASANSSPLAMNQGNNTIEVQVTAAGGSISRTYTLVVTRAPPSHNAQLSDLEVSAGTLTPSFSSTVSTYAVSVPNAVTSIRLTPNAEYTATVEARFNNGSFVTIPDGASTADLPLAEGLNTAVIRVTAEDGITISNYTVEITREVTPEITVALEGGGDLDGTILVKDGSSMLIIPEARGAMALAVGESHVTALQWDGTLKGWGSGAAATVPFGITGVKSIVAGRAHTLALREDGTVIGFGDNTSGQRQVPTGLTGVIAVGAGRDHSLAVRSNGTVVAWGSNVSGERTVPAGLTDVVAVAGGSAFSLALTSDGRVTGWGTNAAGQVNIPPNLTNVKAVAAGGAHGMALLKDGTVRAWGSNSAGQAAVPAGLSGVVAIGAGSTYSVALRNDGTVVAWGSVLVPPGMTGVRAIACGPYSFLTIGSPAASVDFGATVNGTAGGSRTFVMRNPGSAPLEISRVFTGTPGAADFTPDLTGMATTIPVGGQASFSVRFSPVTAGARRAMLQIFSNDGDESPFEVELTGHAISTDAGLSSLTTSAGPLFPAFTAAHGAYDVNASVAVKTIILTPTASWPLATVEVRAAGGNFVPVASGMPSAELPLSPGANTFEVRVAAEDGVTVRVLTLTVYRGDPPQLVVEQAGTLMQCPSSSIFVWGAAGAVLSNAPSGAADITQIAAGGEHALALRRDGTVIAWGSNASGQATVPAGLADVVAVAAGNAHSVALQRAGTVVVWGSNSSGQSAVPAGLTGVMAIAAGENHTLAVKRDGTMRAWGRNNSSQSTVPSGITTAAWPAGGDRHSLVRLSSGTVQVWGDNSFGQRTVPAAATGLTTVAAGFNHCLGISAAGALFAWGSNSSAQSVVPSGLPPVVAVAGGTAHSVALLNDGRVTAWGSNAAGQTGVPAGLDASLITARSDYCLASGRLLTPVDFGRIAVEAPAPVTRTFTLRNTGEVPLHISAVSFAGGDLSFFTLNTVGMSATVPGNGGETAFTVSYLTTVVKQHAARVRIVSDAGPEPFDIMLTGTGSSNNAALSSLTAGFLTLSPAFSPNVTEYTVNVLSQQNGVLFVPAVAMPPASIEFRMNGGAWRAVSSGSSTGTEDLVVGPNVAELKVTASDGVTQRLYKITITRPAPDTDSMLSALTVSAGPLMPAFSPGVTSYVVDTPNSVVQTTAAVTRTSPFANAVMRMNGGEWQSTGPWQLIVGVNVLEVLVTAQDGGTRTYRVEIRRPPAPEIAVEYPPGVPLALTGTVVVWGDNVHHQRDVPAGLTGVVSIAAGSYHTMALLNSGLVVNWGAESAVPAGLNDVRVIAASLDQSMAATGSAGTLTVWGSATLPPPAGLSGITGLSASDTNRLAVHGDGSVTAWGNNTFGQATVPAGLSNVKAAAAGRDHSMALHRDGTVSVWGSNVYGQRNIPDGLAGVTAIAAGDYWCLALRSDGTVAAWGDITDPGDFADVTAISAYTRHALLLKRDGTVTSFGNNSYGQRNVPAGLKNVRAVASGDRHSVALVKEPSLNFGSAPQGGTPVFKVLTVRNTGTALLRIAGAGFVEGEAADFSFSGLPETVPINTTAEFTAAFSPLGTGIRTATLRVSNDDADEGSYDLVFTGTGVAPWEYWQQTNFAASAVGTGPEEDFDGDGVSNLLEFACATDPRVNSPGALRYSGPASGGGSISATGQPAVIIAEGGEIRALYIRRKDRLPAGLTYTPQFTNGQDPWSESAAPGTVLAQDAAVELVSLPFPPDTRFFRIRVQFGP